MQTRPIIFTIMLGLLIACGKDDGPHGPDPKPDPQNRAPAPFALLTPETGEENASRTPSLSWEQATDPDGDTVVYEVYLDNQEAPATLIAKELNTTSYALTENLQLGETYYWKVVAKDSKGASAESEVRSYHVKMPIKFLTRFLSSGDKQVPPISTSFSYSDGKLVALNNNGDKWEVTYDMADNHFSGFGRNQEAALYLFSENQQQKSVEFQSGVSVSKWTFAYDTEERITDIILEGMLEGDGPFSLEFTFHYNSEDTAKPFKIEATSSEFPPTVITLEWQGGNITTMIIEGSGEGGLFYSRREYEYDNNINPYYTILTEKFGFGEFFVINVATQLETIAFDDAIFWQSRNNIIKTETFAQSKGEVQLVETKEYDYTYTEDYYPRTAIITVSSSPGGMQEVTTKELSWSY